jgi:hypothetical protein
VSPLSVGRVHGAAISIVPQNRNLDNLSGANICGAVAERLAAASVLRHPVGQADGAQLDYNLLYRWFMELSPDGPVSDPTTRAAAERGGVCQVHDHAFEPTAGQAAVVERTFFRWTERRLRRGCSIKPAKPLNRATKP